MIKKEISPQELFVRINEFLKEYHNKYSAEEKEFILENYSLGRKHQITYAILQQIYDQLDLLEETDNIYTGFIDLVKDNFNIDQNIIEVGGGRLPRIGTKIAMQQKNGTITVYDPRLLDIDSPLDNLKLKKEMFTETTNLKNQHLMIGFMPCEASEIMIKRACENQMDFVVALCNCGSSNDYSWYESTLDWYQYMLETTQHYLKKENNGILGIASLAKYGDPYPVIYNKRRN